MGGGLCIAMGASWVYPELSAQCWAGAGRWRRRETQALQPGRFETFPLTCSLTTGKSLHLAQPLVHQLPSGDGNFCQE